MPGNRGRLDALLQRKAATSGSTLCHGRDLDSPFISIIENERRIISGIPISNEESKETMKADRPVAADFYAIAGRSGTIGAAAGLH